jgi:hypothetical protein
LLVLVVLVVLVVVLLVLLVVLVVVVVVLLLKANFYAKGPPTPGARCQSNKGTVCIHFCGKLKGLVTESEDERGLNS